MNVAETKLAAINEILKLKSEIALKEILVHLKNISERENSMAKPGKFFNKVADRYDDILRKLPQE